MSPILAVHICGGTLGLISGAAAICFRKGSPRHAFAGKIFVLSMLTMAGGAVYVATLKHEPGNISGGIFAFYLILTAWLTARRRDGETSKLDWAALPIPLALGIFALISDVEKMRSPGTSRDGVPAGMGLFMGSVMLLAAAGDVRMLVRHGILGAKRIVRHLWRMCFGLFIATGSFFLGPANRPLRFLRAIGLRQQLFRALLREEVLLFLAVLPLLLLIFWVVRIRFTNVLKRMPVGRKRDVYSLPAQTSSSLDSA